MCSHGATRAHIRCVATDVLPYHGPRTPTASPPKCSRPHRLSIPHLAEHTAASHACVSIGPVRTLADGCSVAHQAPKAFPTGALPCKLEGRARCRSLLHGPGLAEPPRGSSLQTRVPGLGPPLRDKLLSQSPGWPREGVANRHRQSSKPPREGCWWPSPGLGTEAALGKAQRSSVGAAHADGRLRGHPRCVPGCTGG